MFSIGKRANAHVTELLSAYLDNQLKPQERARAEAHLRDCDVCTADLHSLQATVETLRALPSIAVPRSFILQPVYQPRRASPLVPVLRLASSFAALALVLSLAAGVYLRSPQTAMAPASSPAATLAAAPTAKAAAPQPATQALGAVAPTAVAAAPMAAGSAAPTTVSDSTTSAEMKAATPVPLTAAPPALAAQTPTAANEALRSAATVPTATPTAVPSATATASPSPATAPTVAPTPTIVPPTPAPARRAISPASAFGPLQAVLAFALVLLVLATVIAGRRQR